MSVTFNRRTLFRLEGNISVADLLVKIGRNMNLSSDEFHLEKNGKNLSLDHNLTDDNIDVRVILNVLGGKGGFGSMLRAIGAQIEKTTNREACRDLSGRRLRDINEEQRLKNWIATQADRDKEVAERRKKKLEKLCQEPKHEFSDETYDKERSELPEKIEDAVLQGLQASSSSKRPADEEQKKKNKKKKLWLDDDLEDLSTSEEENSETECSEDLKKQVAVS